LQSVSVDAGVTINAVTQQSTGQPGIAGVSQVRLAQSPLLTLAVATSTGIAQASYSALHSKSASTIVLVIGGSLTLFAITCITRNKRTVASVSLVAAFLCAGFILSFIETRPAAHKRISRMYDEGLFTQGDPVEITGVVQGQPESAPDSFYLTIRVERISFKGSERDASGTVILLAHAREEHVCKEYYALELRHGARVRVVTMLDREENFRNPGALPLTEYLDRKGYDATGVVKSPLLIERLDDERVFLPLACLYEWRQHLEEKFVANFSPETAGILEAALLGNRYNISLGAAERFRAGGTFHVLVISGLQIAFVGGLVIFLARRLIRRKLLQFVIAVIFMWGYTIAVGADPSVSRSVLMFTLIVFAPLVWRRANTLNVIGGAALALLVWQPENLLDPSFQLTFLSVLSIVLIAVPVMRGLQRVGSWRPTPRDALSASVLLLVPSPCRIVILEREAMAN
jgi:ComEC/Rec2-related protein